jgi:hypothetical protein
VRAHLVVSRPDAGYVHPYPTVHTRTPTAVVVVLHRTRRRYWQRRQREGEELVGVVEEIQDQALAKLVSFNFRLMDRFTSTALAQARASYLACSVAGVAALLVLLIGQESNQERTGLDRAEYRPWPEPGPASGHRHDVQLRFPATPCVERDEVRRQCHTDSGEMRCQVGQSGDVTVVVLSPIIQPLEASTPRL